MMPDRTPILGLLLIRFMWFIPNALDAMLARFSIVSILAIMLLFFMLLSMEAACIKTLSWGTFLNAS